MTKPLDELNELLRPLGMLAEGSGGCFTIRKFENNRRNVGWTAARLLVDLIKDPK